MDKTISMEIPADWLDGLEIDSATLAQEIVKLGIQQFKVRRALEMYRAHVGSLGYIAERLELSKRDLIREAQMRGIDPYYDEQTLQEELGK